ncbi:hypothetical protein LTR56_016584 [Elasticomyces elasticus]|nr:hypothetical protein LTR56_016584 [Elasticomyces elasticus]KAK3650615.1 hypothetical protein LTR22_012473 [Elasticomyces elasticus]KAK4913948.1 hypothetical protein LTR49_017766 [Elasticomyces elasticus]KAK5753112.1 hypothetical protein LTS12_016791 [Elasticomyces elasticus]
MATKPFSDMDGDHAFHRANAVIAKLSALHQQERRVRAESERAGELQYPEDEDPSERARHADGRMSHLTALTRDVVDRRTAALEVGERMRDLAASHLERAPSMAADEVAVLRRLKWQFIDATHDLRRPEELNGKSVEHPSENGELTIGEDLKNVESMMEGVSAEPERLHPSDAFSLEQLREIMGDQKNNWSLEDVCKQTRKYRTEAGSLRRETEGLAKLREDNEQYAQELQEWKEKHRLSEKRVQDLEEELEQTKGSLEEELNAMKEKNAMLEQQMGDVVAGIAALVELEASDWDNGTVGLNVAKGVQVEEPEFEDLDVRALHWDLSVRPTPSADDCPIDAWSMRRLWLRTCKTVNSEALLDDVEVSVAWLSRGEPVRADHRRDALAAAIQYYRSSNGDPDALVMARLLEVAVRAKVSRVDLWPVWQTWRLASSTQKSSPLLLGLADWLEEQIGDRTSVRTMLDCAAVHTNAMDTITDVKGRTLVPYEGRFLIVDPVNRFLTDFSSDEIELGHMDFDSGSDMVFFMRSRRIREERFSVDPFPILKDDRGQEWIATHLQYASEQRFVRVAGNRTAELQRLKL